MTPLAAHFIPDLYVYTAPDEVLFLFFKFYFFFFFMDRTSESRSIIVYVV